MKRILVLRKRKTRHERNKVLYRFLKDYLHDKAEFVLAEYNDIFLSIKTGEIIVKLGGLSGQNITDFDLVWFRSPGRRYHKFAIALAGCFDFLHIDYIDTSLGQRAMGGNKLIGLVRLVTGGLPVLSTFFCWAKNLHNDLEQIANEFGFPLVLKKMNKHWGEGVFILKNIEDLEKAMDKIKSQDKFIFQKFYSNDGDYRILVLDYHIGSWEKMAKAKNYYPQPVGGLTKKEFFPIEKIPLKIKQLAIKAAKRVSFEIAGVDILQDKETGQYFLTEVNRVPAIAIDYPGDPELLALSKFFEKKLKV